MDGRVEHRQGEGGDRIAVAVEWVQSPPQLSLAKRRKVSPPRMDMRQVSPSSRFRRVAQAWMIRSAIIATSAIPKPATRPLPVSTRVSAS